MKAFGPAYLICDREFVSERIDAYSRNGWPKAQWITAAEALLDMGLQAVLYEDKSKNWRHFRITKVGDERQFVLGMHYGDDKPPIAVHGCDFVVRRGNGTLMGGLTAVSQAFAIRAAEYADFADEGGIPGEP